MALTRNYRHTPEQIRAEIRGEVMRALGEASMCWSETPGGLFDTARAVQVGERLTDHIARIVERER